MAGHSKWANIKHRKERQDAKKGKIFTKWLLLVRAAVIQAPTRACVWRWIKRWVRT